MEASARQPEHDADALRRRLRATIRNKASSRSGARFDTQGSTAGPTEMERSPGYAAATPPNASDFAVLESLAKLGVADASNTMEAVRNISRMPKHELKRMKKRLATLASTSTAPSLSVRDDVEHARATSDDEGSPPASPVAAPRQRTP